MPSLKSDLQTWSPMHPAEEREWGGLNDQDAGLANASVTTGDMLTLSVPASLTVLGPTSSPASAIWSTPRAAAMTREAGRQNMTSHRLRPGQRGSTDDDRARGLDWRELPRFSTQRKR